MIIANFQVHHVLKAYSQQLADGPRSSKPRANKTPGQKDEVTFSSESKKRLLTDKITQEILSQFKNGGDLGQTGQKILDQLSQEYGQPLEVLTSKDQGMAFVAVGNDPEQGKQALSPEETEQLKKRLFDITQATVYNDLI